MVHIIHDSNEKNQVICEEQFSVKLIGFHDVTLGIMFTTDRWQKLIEANLESSTVWLRILMSAWERAKVGECVCGCVNYKEEREKEKKK